MLRRTCPSRNRQPWSVANASLAGLLLAIALSLSVSLIVFVCFYSPDVQLTSQESEDLTGPSNDQDSRSDTPVPVPSLKAESVNSDSAKSVSVCSSHFFCPARVYSSLDFFRSVWNSFCRKAPRNKHGFQRQLIKTLRSFHRVFLSKK